MQAAEKISKLGIDMMGKISKNQTSVQHVIRESRVNKF